MIALNARLVQK